MVVLQANIAPLLKRPVSRPPNRALRQILAPEKVILLNRKDGSFAPRQRRAQICTLPKAIERLIKRVKPNRLTWRLKRSKFH
jgi:hypothetical protein